MSEKHCFLLLNSSHLSPNTTVAAHHQNSTWLLLLFWSSINTNTHTKKKVSLPLALHFLPAWTRMICFVSCTGREVLTKMRGGEETGDMLSSSQLWVVNVAVAQPTSSALCHRSYSFPTFFQFLSILSIPFSVCFTSVAVSLFCTSTRLSMSIVYFTLSLPSFPTVAALISFFL